MISALKNSVENLAFQYFDYLARCFPVMCASDEFHFLPRAEDAAGERRDPHAVVLRL